MSPEILPQVSKIICVGQNYAAHARKLGNELPTEPVLFQKAPSSWAGLFEPLELLIGAEKLDYKVELGVVEITDPQDVRIWSKVSGEIRQEIVGVGL